MKSPRIFPKESISHKRLHRCFGFAWLNRKDGPILAIGPQHYRSLLRTALPRLQKDPILPRLSQLFGSFHSYPSFSPDISIVLQAIIAQCPKKKRKLANPAPFPLTEIGRA